MDIDVHCNKIHQAQWCGSKKKNADSEKKSRVFCLIWRARTKKNSRHDFIEPLGEIECHSSIRTYQTAKTEIKIEAKLRRCAA